MDAILITNSTPIYALTVGQFKELISACVSEKESTSIAQAISKEEVYGLRGIRNLFNVSEATAQRYKNTFLAPAVSQNGRKLVIDVEKARELFKQEGLPINRKKL